MHSIAPTNSLLALLNSIANRFINTYQMEDAVKGRSSVPGNQFQSIISAVWLGVKVITAFILLNFGYIFAGNNGGSAKLLRYPLRSGTKSKDDKPPLSATSTPSSSRRFNFGYNNDIYLLHALIYICVIAVCHFWRTFEKTMFYVEFPAQAIVCDNTIRNRCKIFIDAGGRSWLD